MIRVLACLALLVSLAPRVCPQQDQVYILVNQIGFTVGGAKTAIVFGNGPLPAEFRIFNVESGALVFSGKVDVLAGGWGQFARYGELDF